MENMINEYVPKVGDWAIFDSYTLGRFWKRQGSTYYFIKGNFINISKYSKIPDSNIFYSATLCEPFVGVLPETLKSLEDKYNKSKIIGNNI